MSENRLKLYTRQNEIRITIKEISSGIIVLTKHQALSQLRITKKLWKEFAINHQKILQERGSKDDDYFRENTFAHVKSEVEQISEAFNRMLYSDANGGHQTDKALKKVEKEVVKKEENTGKQQQMQHSTKAKALLFEFERCIRRLKQQFEEIDQIDDQFMLEEAKETWQKQHDNISDIYMKLCVDHLLNDEKIVERKEEIENQHRLAKRKLLQKLNELTEIKKAVSLDKIKIPSFNGNIEEWLSFHDLFKKFVHENKTLSDVEKMYQLKSLLRNDALNIIKHLPVSESNYAAAWELLNQRFDNRRLLFQSLIDRIIQQPNVSSNNASMMKSLHDVTNECMQGLRAMKCNIEGADAVIARIVIQKLDNEGLILYEQHTKKSKEIQVLSDVLEFLEEQCQSLELAKSRRPDHFNYNSSSEKQMQQTNAMTVSTDEEFCLYCEKGGHTTEFCGHFLALEVEDRLEWAKITKTCFQCLTHKFTYNCLSKSTCDTCGMAHHNILHIPSVSTSVTRPNNDILLPSAQVRMLTEKGENIALKISIDQESKTVFIEEE